MLRIAPQANQFTLPSPQPLTMLLPQLGRSSSASSRKGTTSNEPDYKMLPGDKRSYMIAQHNLEADYRSKLNKVFNDAMQSDEGPEAYAIKESTINELQGYHQAYQNDKITLDSQKDLLEQNLTRYASQVDYFRKEGVDLGDYVYDNKGNIMGTAQDILTINENKAFNQSFMNYTIPDEEALNKSLASHLDKAAQDKSFYEQEELLGSEQIGTGKQLKPEVVRKTRNFQIQVDGETRDYALNERQLTSAFNAWIGDVNSNQELSRAYNAKQNMHKLSQAASKAAYDKEGLEYTEKSFQEAYLDNEIDLRRVHINQVTDRLIDDGTGGDDGGAGGDIVTNYLGEVLLGRSRHLQTREQRHIFDDINRDVFTDYIPSVRNSKRMNNLITQFDNAVTALAYGKQLDETKIDKDIFNILNDNLDNAIDNMQFGLDTEEGKKELATLLNEHKGEYLQKHLSEDDMKEVNKYVYGITDNMTIQDGENIQQASIRIAREEIAEMENNGEISGRIERERAFHKSVAKNFNILNSGGRLIPEPSMQNWEVKDIVRYGNTAEAYDFPYEEFTRTSLNLATVNKDVQFLGNYLSPEKLTHVESDGSQIKPVIVGGEYTYSAMPWKNDTKTAGAMVKVMVKNTKEVRKQLALQFPDQFGKMNKTNVNEIDNDRYGSMGIDVTKVSDNMVGALQKRGNNDYEENDEVLIISVNIAYDQIINDMRRQLPNSQNTLDYMEKVMNYQKGQTVNPADFGIEVIR